MRILAPAAPEPFKVLQNTITEQTEELKQERAAVQREREAAQQKEEALQRERAEKEQALQQLAQLQAEKGALDAEYKLLARRAPDAAGAAAQARLGLAHAGH